MDDARSTIEALRAARRATVPRRVGGTSPLTTTVSLRKRSAKELAQIARKKGISGWHTMRKEELIEALLQLASQSTKTAGSRHRSAAESQNGVTKQARLVGQTGHPSRCNGHAVPSSTSKSNVKPKASGILRQIQAANNERERLKDLSGSRLDRDTAQSNESIKKDRAILMVRDPYWLHAYWEISRQAIERVRSAMAEHWHTAQPILRLFALDDTGTTNTAERMIRDVLIHGGVNNWYLDVQDPPNNYRFVIGYLASNGKFRSVVRSNAVRTPRPGSSDAIDRNWSDIAENYERVYAMSGGYAAEGSAGDLQELFEERLRRPMGSPIVTKFGAGAQGLHVREREFDFEVDAEMIIYGATKPDSYVTLDGEPIRLRRDGSFTVRLSMPDKRQVIPVVASSADGVEQRTVVLAIERNTKIMEPKFRDANE